ncbi:MAG: hypothetical protein NTV93_00685 [Verrucomicrobia bacterium]|nr:hypothetical protein [Verrucomicrobiota bacterium]
MRRLIFLLPVFFLCGCAPSYFVAFSNGYNPATSYLHSLPAIALAPGETRKAFLPAQKFAIAPVSSIRVTSENPAVAIIWEPFDPGDVVRIQAVAPGSTLIHRGDFPFPNWKLKANPVERAAWRAALRRYLRPRPDDTAFRAISDADLWKTVLRSRSSGALRVVVEEDRLNFQLR